MARKNRYHGFIGLAVLGAAEALMLAGVKPFTNWFYSLAWWSYIFIVDQAVYRLKGNSLWVNRRREFWLLIPTSVCFWMTFEGLNAYLGNWFYVGVTRDEWVRWLGYFIAYATVLPGIFETTELLETLGVFRRARIRPVSKTQVWYWPFFLTGCLFLYLPIFWPKYFFPLIWGGFVFLLEPLVHARGGRSLMRDWEQGSPRNFLLLLTSGLICGLLWEFWNFWAESKWVYEVPFVGWLKVFEMPVLGFLGFPPFAVELYVMTAAVSVFRNGRGWHEKDAGKPGGASPLMVLLGILLFLSIYIMAGRSIEFFTIRSYS